MVSAATRLASDFLAKHNAIQLEDCRRASNRGTATIDGRYFGALAGDGVAFADEGEGRGVTTGGFGNGAALGPAGEVPGVGEGTGFFSAIREARSLSTWSTVDFAIR